MIQFFNALCQARICSLYIFVSSKNQTSCTCFCSKVLVKIVVCQHGICWLFWTKIFPRFSEYTRAVTIKKVFFNKGYSKNFCKSHKISPVLESLFNKVVGLMACNFITNRLQQRCFPVKFAEFLRTPILKNICERLLLNTEAGFQRCSAELAVQH